VGWAAALTGLYAWLKMTQAWFARAVWARLLPDGGLPSLTAGAWFRRTGALLMLASVSLPAQVVAAGLVLPFAWVHAFFHHGVTLAYTHDLGPRPLRRLTRLSARLAHHEPLAHHFSLLLLLALGLLVWGAVFAAGLVLPFLLKILTGLESEFTRNPLAAAFDSLYLSVTVSVAWMIVSPYVRVVYGLRTFQVRSRRTGEDLLARLEAARSRAAAVAAAGLLLLIVPSVAGATAPGADPSPPVRSSVDAPGVPPSQGRDLAGAIRATLSAREYQWRLPPMPPVDAAAGESGLVTAFKNAVKTVRDAVREIDRMVSEAGGALRRLLGGGAPGGSSSDAGAAGGFQASALRGVLYLLGGGGLAVLLVGGWWKWRNRHRPPVPAAVAGPPGATVSLADEATLASALPEDEWLRMAQVQRDGGDLRLAVRAVFLATLASLGEQRLIDIARSKSNRDYFVEVRLRAAARREVPEIFGRSVGVFERAWYGLHEVAPHWVQELLDNHQRLTSRDPIA
jgi:hypothetical protein